MEKQRWASGPPFLLPGFSGPQWPALIWSGMTGEKAAEIERLIAPSLAAQGYDVVRVLLMGGARHATLQIMIERADRMAVSVDDCTAASRTVSALLDVEDPIAGTYTLEISSPGIDRPLVKPADFDRFKGYEARFESRTPIDGRRRFRGKLLGMAGDQVHIATPEGESKVPFQEVQRAKLVLTDELIAAAASETTG
jgi:ribosome maturation factor RimP